MPRTTRQAASIVTLLAITACGPSAGVTSRIDGWPVGPVIDCTALALGEIGRVSEPGCERIIRAAMQDHRLAGGSVEDVQVSEDRPTIHALDLVDEASRNIVVRSGAVGDYVVVFDADEGRVVVGVWCGAGIEPDVCGRWDAPPW